MGLKDETPSGTTEVSSTQLEPVKSCPVCDSGERRLLAQNMRDINYGGVGGRWRLFRCCQCRSAYMDSRIDSEHIADAFVNYETHAVSEKRPKRRGILGFLQSTLDAYTHNLYGSPAENKSNFRASLAYLFPLLRLERDFLMRHARKRDGIGKILDIGCGNGDFLARMRDAGWSVHGLDFDPSAAKIADSRGLNVVSGSVTARISSLPQSDLVAASHVIEHVHELQNFLELLYEKVLPGGVLWLATPNINSPLRWLEGRYWDKWETPRHLQMFNMASMRLLIERALGKQVNVSFKRRGWHIYWSMAQSALLRQGQLRGTRPRLPPSRVPLAILLETAALMSPGWGDELIVEIRKPAV